MQSRIDAAGPLDPERRKMDARKERRQTVSSGIVEQDPSTRVAR